MASITAKLLGVNKLGVSMNITMNSDMGEHSLVIRSTQERRYAWMYYLGMPDGRCFHLKCDEFLHDDYIECFDPENIFHVSTMMQKIMVLGHVVGSNAA